MGVDNTDTLETKTSCLGLEHSILTKSFCGILIRTSVELLENKLLSLVWDLNLLKAICPFQGLCKMELIDTIEKLMNEYSNAVDYSFGVCGRSRRRFFKCSFCNRAYKYHSLLRRDFKLFYGMLSSSLYFNDFWSSDSLRTASSLKGTGII